MRSIVMETPGGRGWRRPGVSGDATRQRLVNGRGGAVGPRDGDDQGSGGRGAGGDRDSGGRNGPGTGRRVGGGRRRWAGERGAVVVVEAEQFPGGVPGAVDGFPEGARLPRDLGSGLAAAQNTHQIAQAVNPEARVVYVDKDRCNAGCAHRSPVLSELRPPAGG